MQSKNNKNQKKTIGNEKKDASLKTQNLKNKLEIQKEENKIVRMKYLLDDCYFECNKYMRIFGEEFTEKNKDKCTMVIAEKEYKIVTMIDMDEFERYGINKKNKTVEIILIGEEIKDMSFMFYSCQSLIEVDFSLFNTEKITNMSLMFMYCGSLTRVIFPEYNTRDLTNMAWMFDGCENLTQVNFSSFDTQKVTDMQNMLSECMRLNKVDLSSFDIQNVENMSSMFYGFGGSIKIKRKILNKIKSGSELDNDSQLMILEI